MYANRDSMMTYYQQPQNLWVYRLYNWTHSLVVWAIVSMIIFFISLNYTYTPWFLFAWLLHILIDIPTHTRAFFAPQFLIPLSKFNVDGKSWAHPIFMAVNYSLIILFLILRLLGVLWIIK
jgi:hypothetical protein